MNPNVVYLTIAVALIICGFAYKAYRDWLDYRLILLDRRDRVEKLKMELQQLGYTVTENKKEVV